MKAGIAKIGDEIMQNNSSTSWEDALVTIDATIEQSIKSLNESKLKIVLVVNNGDLIGTITDGDIRRGLLSGVSLSESVLKVTNKEPFSVSSSLTRSEALELMKVNKIYQLPIVNKERKLLGLHLFEELATSSGIKYHNSMLIMAGGKGTRLRPYTESCPKPLLEVAGKPMLQHILEKARSEGFYNFIISLHYLGHMIQDFFGDGRRFGVNIEYINEDKPLGTAGALSLLDGARLESPLLVTNGDVLTDMNYSELLNFHLNNKAAATMAIREHRWENPFGVVKVQGVNLIGFEEKPIICSHINAGVYVLNPECVGYLAKDTYCDMPTLFTNLKDANKNTIVYPMYESWLDVGREDDFNRAQLEVNTMGTSE